MAGPITKALKPLYPGVDVAAFRAWAKRQRRKSRTVAIQPPVDYFRPPVSAVKVRYLFRRAMERVAKRSANPEAQ